MDDVSLTGLISRLRRQTTSRDVLTVLDACERMMADNRALASKPMSREGGGGVGAGFDRRSYQRNYMRSYRERIKNKGGS
jgi:hypothetical protein